MAANNRRAANAATTHTHTFRFDLVGGIGFATADLVPHELQYSEIGAISAPQLEQNEGLVLADISAAETEADDVCWLGSWDWHCGSKGLRTRKYKGRNTSSRNKTPTNQPTAFIPRLLASFATNAAITIARIPAITRIRVTLSMSCFLHEDLLFLKEL